MKLSGPNDPVIRALIVLEPEGLLKRLTVTGHAGSGRKGNDPVCAAVSMLVRTAVRTVEGHAGLDVRYSAGKPGETDLTIGNIPDGERSWLAGVTDMILRGFKDLEMDAPDTIEVVEERS